ncbi:MAG: serine--tRNA ligase [Rickettsiales bacterium]|jgi:seryl-tRNA synthetase|nr:serine--tRNA ligase [Rickettsiales bacterium]
MLDIKFIRENPDTVKWASKVKCFPDHTDEIIELDRRVRELKTLTETKTAEKNKITKQIPTAAAADKAALVAESKKIADEIADELAELAKKESDLNELMLNVPQIPDKNSPVGPDASANVVTKTVGKPAKFDFTPRAHWDILDMNKWWMGDKIADVTGARTYTLMGEAAELDLAIQTFVIKKLIAKGFTYIQVPALAKPQAIFDAGHFRGSDFSIMANDVFYLNVPDKCLAGTAEIVLNSLHKGEILNESDLPIKYAGYSPCYRKEAGAAGRDTRGLIRIHQFHKVEQFIFCRPDQSDEMHALLLSILEEVMADLELPYHVLSTSTGDMGFNKIKMDDVESWFPGQDKYIELGSCSSIGEFQARRTNTRYRDKDGVHFCATLNNTAMALPRSLAAVLENHQNADGGVNIPNALRSLMGGRAKIGG